MECEASFGEFEIAYQVHGEGPPLLLVPGITSTATFSSTDMRPAQFWALSAFWKLPNTNRSSAKAPRVGASSSQARTSGSVAEGSFI